MWDDQAQRSCDALKKVLILSPLLNAPNYRCDFLLHIAAPPSSLIMVLVETHDYRSEHVIYYMSKGLARLKLKYSHVKKLSLSVVFAVNHF